MPRRRRTRRETTGMPQEGAIEESRVSSFGPKPETQKLNRKSARPSYLRGHLHLAGIGEGQGQDQVEVAVRIGLRRPACEIHGAGRNDADDLVVPLTRKFNDCIRTERSLVRGGGSKIVEVGVVAGTAGQHIVARAAIEGIV